MTSLRVDIAVGSRFHLFDLARELHAQGALGLLYTGYPRSAAAKFGVPVDKVRSCLPYELANRLLSRAMRSGRNHDFIQSSLHRLFALWVSTRLTRGAQVFVGLSGTSQEIIPQAKALNMVTVVERGSSHIDWPRTMAADVARQSGLTFHVPSVENSQRERTEYESADYIAVPGSYARDTFVRHGIDVRKILVNPYGVDLQNFRAEPKRRIPGKPLTVIHVGRISIRKGVHHLVQAIDRAPETRLLLVGGLDPGMRRLVRHPRVTVIGPVPQTSLPDFYRQADIFCLLSLDEGFGMVLLQAGAMGMPIIATTSTGAVDVYKHGESAFLVAPFAPTEAADRLKQLGDDPSLSLRLGQGARRAVEFGFSWRDYGARALQHYESAVGRRCLSS